MAEKTRYPPIPSNVWWGIRDILNKTPSATVDGQFLAAHLGVQEAAARAYVAELVGAGLLDSEKKATPLAHKWKLDPTYSEAEAEILDHVYPAGLRDVAPAADGERQKAIHWFQMQGLGSGAAGNKAATYFMIGSPKPNESSGKSIPKEDSASVSPKAKVPAPLKTKKVSGKGGDENSDPKSMPLNINLQIHISADAGTEQIDAIFAAMKRYLHDQ